MQTSLNLRLAANHSYIVALSSVLCACALYSVFVHCILCFTTLTQVFWSVVECASCVQPLCNTNTSPWPGWEGGTSQSGVITSWEVWPPGSQGRPSYLAGSWKMEGHFFAFFRRTYFSVFLLWAISHTGEKQFVCKGKVVSSPLLISFTMCHEKKFQKCCHTQLSSNPN